MALRGEGAGEDVGGAFDLRQGEQAEEALHEKAGFAGAGGGFDDPGSVDIEGLLAGGGVGRGWRLGRLWGVEVGEEEEVIHRRGHLRW